MSYVYGKIKNIKNDGKSVSFKVESDWKIIDYENENKILSMYCVNENSYNPYNEKEVCFEIDYGKNNKKIIDFLINNIHEHYKIEFEKIEKNTKTIKVSSLEIINE